MVLFSVDLLVQLGLCQGSVLNTEVSLYLALALVSELLLGLKRKIDFWEVAVESKMLRVC